MAEESDLQKFHLGDILSVTTGILASPDRIEGLARLLKYMAGGDGTSTLSLGRFSNEATPYLYEQHPWLKEIKEEDIAGEECLAKVAKLIEKYGEYHEVRPMHPEDHEILSDVEEFYRRGLDPNKLLIMDLTEPPVNPTGDINWKVDEDEDDE